MNLKSRFGKLEVKNCGDEWVTTHSIGDPWYLKSGVSMVRSIPCTDEIHDRIADKLLYHRVKCHSKAHLRIVFLHTYSQSSEIRASMNRVVPSDCSIKGKSNISDDM